MTAPTKVLSEGEAHAKARALVHGVLKDGFSECIDHEVLGWSHGPRCELLTADLVPLLLSVARTAREAGERELAALGADTLVMIKEAHKAGRELAKARAALAERDRELADRELAEARATAEDFNAQRVAAGRALAERERELAEVRDGREYNLECWRVAERKREAAEAALATARGALERIHREALRDPERAGVLLELSAPAPGTQAAGPRCTIYNAACLDPVRCLDAGACTAGEPSTGAAGPATDMGPCGPALRDHCYVDNHEPDRESRYAFACKHCGEETAVCEGCTEPATEQDVEGVPLCRGCYDELDDDEPPTGTATKGEG